MKSLLAWSFVVTGASLTNALPSLDARGHNPPSCRFALDWSQKDVVDRPDEFAWDLLYWEGKFHQNDVSYNVKNGMSYDGTQLDWSTGEHTEKHNFSAASKEALQFILYAQAIAGNREAARFLSPDNLDTAPRLAASILETKLETYLRFNHTYPGFGGFLPWIKSNEQDISPQDGWDNLVPGLDNGELIWGVYGAIQALESHHEPYFQNLAMKWQQWLDYIASTAVEIFYRGEGKVCAVTEMTNMSWPISHPNQTYKCQTEAYLDDPYEGELLTYFIQFYGVISDAEKEKLWEFKRPNLNKTEYDLGGVGPVTVREGYWFSSHETWNCLELPYYDVDLIKRLFKNAERVRTCNSVVTKVPGMFASINNSTDPKTDTIIGYISAAGIPSVASQKDQELDVITPYSVFPTVLFDRGVGLAWWRNMVVGKKMQNPYGSTESTRIDGELVSALLTWDSKVTTVVALMGGVTDLVRDRMKAEGIYDEFLAIAQREYSLVFDELKGEDIELCLPKEEVPDAGLEDFTACKRR